MRPAALLFGVIALGAAAYGAHALARLGVARFEAATRAEAVQALAGAEQGWAEVEIDGLGVRLAGEAPDEAALVRALGALRGLVDDGRIENRATVRAADAVPPPDFALEILRDDARVSLIGLVPLKGGRAAIGAGLRSAGLDGAVSDMLQTADQPMPPGWTDSLALGLAALRETPRAKVSVAPGHVEVAAAVESDAARRALETTLYAARPREVTLTLDITAPRPVISPYRVDFVSDGAAGHFDACSAETPADAAAIAEAARPLGLAGTPDCAVGLGAPSPDWAAAVTRGLGALGALGGGRFAIKDGAAVLTGPAGVAAERLTEIGARLARELPPGYRLATIAPPRMVTAEDGAEVYAPRFAAVLDAKSGLRLSGALRDETTRGAVESYAAALMGRDRVSDGTVIDPSLPDGWSSRVLLGVAALAELTQGRLEITAEKVALAGEGADVATNARVAALLAEKLGPDGAKTDLTLAPPPAPAPEPAEPAKAPEAKAARPEAAAHCAEDVTAILAEGQIRFSPGSAEIDPESHGTLLAMADVLRACPGGRFEIGGHTDAQGSDTGNQRLSQRRAEAVAAALAREVPGLALSARGYGEAEPIADNATEAGRALNRRITFVSLDGGAAPAAEAPADETPSGETPTGETPAGEPRPRATVAPPAPTGTAGTDEGIENPAPPAEEGDEVDE